MLNNKSLALINSLTAINNSLVSTYNLWDVELNTPTETLLLELEIFGYKYKSSYLLDILKIFSNLQQKYQWGSNYFYHSVINIHPTYIQNLLDDKRHN